MKITDLKCIVIIKNPVIRIVTEEDIIGPDSCDVGGIAELKWVAEFADMHDVLIAPHGIGDGLIGLATLVQVSVTLPSIYVAFEYPLGKPGCDRAS